jgi:hypothetical protein
MSGLPQSQLEFVSGVANPSGTVFLHTSSSPWGGWEGILIGVVVTLVGAAYAWRVTRVSGIQVLWIGIVLEMAGFGGDAYWHRVLGAKDVGLVPPAHWLIILGAVVALVGAIRTWRNTDSGVAYPAVVASVAASAQVVGTAWDNALHYTGTEPAPTALPHLLKSLGMVLLLLAALVVVGAEWRTRTATPTEGN